MEMLKYEVGFLTPAFLGNATQNAQWRTPPFKALLRQWWRVAWLANNAKYPKLEEMRNKEGEIFGTASSENSRKSPVRMRLGEWSRGSLNQSRWKHSVRASETTDMLYAGFGVLKSASEMSRECAIDCNEKNILSIAVPTDYVDEIRVALCLIDRFGTIGGRSRNGWGSLILRDLDNGRIEMPLPALPESIFRPLEKTLELSWPHAIGRDQDGPLIWKTEQSFKNWMSMMEMFGSIRKGIRKIQKAPKGKRLPNNIRFKACRDKETPERLRGIVFHLPCTLPDTQQARWNQIHEELDREMSRVSG